MATYVYKTGAGGETVRSVTVNLAVSDTITEKVDYPSISGAVEVFSHWWTTYANLGGITFGAMSMGQGWVVSYNGQDIDYITGASLSKTVELKETSNYKELFTPESSSTFRSKVHCGTPESALKVSYSDNNAYELYYDGTLLGTVSSYDFNTLKCGVSHESLPQGIVAGTPGWYGGTGIVNGSLVMTNLVLPNDFSYNCQYTEDGLARQFIVSHASGITWNGNSAQEITYTKPIEQAMAYNYLVNIPDITNYSNLSFTAQSENKSWTGQTSPTFWFTNGAYYTLNVSETSQTGVTLTTSSTHLQSTTAKGGATWSDGTDSMPTQIGNVVLNNPEDINDYQEYSTKDASGKEKGDEGYDPDTRTLERHKELRLIACNRKRNFGIKVLPKTIISKSNWTGVNCSIVNGEISNVTDGAYIYCDLYRNKYAEEKDPDGILNNTEYRQKHFTKLRFIKIDGTKTVDSETSAWTPNISLICKSYGDYCDGHTWTAKYDNTYQCYDLIKCNGGTTGTTDEIISGLLPEDYKLYDEGAESGEYGYGVTYVNELPNTNVGWLPNIVGQVKIKIPTGATYSIGDLVSVFNPPVNLTQLTLEWESPASQTDYAWVSDTIANAYVGTTPPIATKTGSTTDESWRCWYIPSSYNVGDINVYITKKDGSSVELDASSWVNTFDYKISKFTLEFETNIGTCYLDYTVSDHSYYRFIQYTDSDGTGVKVEKAKWTDEEGNDYTFDEYSYLLTKQNLYYAQPVPYTGVILQCGNEFKEMAYSGEHEPKPADEQEMRSWDSYESRYATITINGARSVDIPETLKLRAPTTMVSQIKTLSFGYNEISVPTSETETAYIHPSIVFSRDDLGEIGFGIETFTADSDGYYPIEALTTDKYTWISWLRSGISRLQIGQPSWAGTVQVLVDKLKGDALSRYLPATWTGTGWASTTIIEVVGDYGGVYSGADCPQEGQTISGSITENSAFISGTLTIGDFAYDVYNAYGDTVKPNLVRCFGRKHGKSTSGTTSWQINGISRQLAKVYDGMKYTLSYIYVVTAGKILRNSAGKILRNSLNKILRG